MTNVYFPDEQVKTDDLYFVCYMIERIARRLKQPNKYVANAMGHDELARKLSLADVLHFAILPRRHLHSWRRNERPVQNEDVRDATHSRSRGDMAHGIAFR